MKPPVLLFALSVALLPVSAGGQGTQPSDFEIAAEAVRRGEILSLAQILALVEQEQRGDVIEVELEVENGELIYEVELITPDGRLMELALNARTGAVLSFKEDD